MRHVIFLLLLLTQSCSPVLVVHPFRLLPGQDLKQEIQAYAETHQLAAGWVMTCVGSLTRVKLRLANQDTLTTLDGHFEIVGLVGTVSTSGSHLHLTVSDSLGQTTGGHLVDGNLVYTTAEIVLGESNKHVFHREVDGSTPYEELRVETLP